MKIVLMNFPVLLSTSVLQLYSFFYPKITVNIYLHVCATGFEVVSSVLGCVHFSVE